MRTCPRCNAQIEDQARFCDNCGAPAAGGPMPAGGGGPPGQGGGVTCSSCGFANLPGEAFCENCGVQLPAVGGGASAGTPGAAGIPPSYPGGPPSVTGGPSSASGTCAACGYLNLPGETFCQNCGVQLGPVSFTPPPPPSPVPASPPAGPAAAQAVPSPWSAPAPPPISVYGLSGRLIVRGTSASFRLPQGHSEAILGKYDAQANLAPEIDLTNQGPDSNWVSRRHARLVAQGGQVFIEDLNSTNHTFLNKQKLQPGQRYPLKDGDEIRLGKLVLTYASR